MAEIRNISQAESPYFPFKGVNVDSNGLAMDPEECSMCRNFDILGTDMELRPGSISLSANRIWLPKEDVIHFEEFKHPNGTTLLFAFTDRDIYFYDPIEGWNTCIDIDLFQGHTFNNWSTTQIVDKVLGATLIAAGSWLSAGNEASTKGDERVLIYFDQSDYLFKRFDMLQQIPVVEEDTLKAYPEANAAKLYFLGVSMELLNSSKWKDHSTTEVKVSFASTVGGTKDPAVTIVMKKDDDSVTSIFEEATQAEISVLGNGEVRATDIASALSGNENISRILRTLDSSFNVPLAAQAKTYFKKSVSGIVTGNKLVNNITDTAGFSSIVPHTFTLSLGTGEGIIAQAGTTVHSLPVGKAALGDAADGVSVDCYRLVPTNFEIASYDTDSYVRVDGLEWQIRILRPTYAGAALLANYDYYQTSPYKPVYVATHRNALVIGNTYEDGVYFPWRLRWSEINDISKIKFYSYQDFLQRKLSSIIGIATLNTVINNDAAGFLYVHLNDFIYRGVPDNQLFLRFEIAYLEGVLCPKTIVEADGMFFYVGNNDIYAFDGLNRQSITKRDKSEHTRVRNYIYSNLDYFNLDKNFAVYDSARRKIWFFFKFNNNAGTYAKDVAVYDIDARIWYFYSVPETSAVTYAKIVSPTTPIDALRGNIADLTGNIEDLSVSLPYMQRVVAAMTKEVYVYAGGTYKDKISSVSAGEDIVGELITRDFIGKFLENQDRVEQVKVEASGEGFIIGYNTDYSLSSSEFSLQEERVISNKYKLYDYFPDITHYHVRFLLKVVSKKISFKWLQVYRIIQELTND